MEKLAERKASTTGYFRPRRLGHANVYISDYDAALHFWRDVVGLGDGWLRPEIRGGFLNNGATHHDIGFIPWNSPHTRKKVAGPGLNHLGFELENERDLVLSYNAARAAGQQFMATVDHTVALSVYSSDPEGYGIEIYVDTAFNYHDPEWLKLSRASTTWTPDLAKASAEPKYVANHQPRLFTDALFHATKITGAVFVAHDYAASYDYYTGLVGLTALAGDRQSRFSVLGGSAGQHDVVLLRPGEGRAPGLHHLRYETLGDADLAVSISRAEASGVKVDSTIDHTIRLGCLIRDPGGLGVQLVAERRRPTASELLNLPDDLAVWLT